MVLSFSEKKYSLCIVMQRRNIMDYRIEKDSMGEMKVPANAYWGAQTQRSFENFKKMLIFL